MSKKLVLKIELEIGGLDDVPVETTRAGNILAVMMQDAISQDKNLTEDFYDSHGMLIGNLSVEVN